MLMEHKESNVFSPDFLYKTVLQQTCLQYLSVVLTQNSHVSAEISLNLVTKSLSLGEKWQLYRALALFLVKDKLLLSSTE